MTGVADLQGHWCRAWIKAPGFEDHTTHVHWIQCGTHYVDLRLPAELPDLTGARALCDLPPEALLALMSSEGFAGHIEVADSVCTWIRDINWHGTPKTVDAGRMWFQSTDHLIEDGVHADYRELWLRELDQPNIAQTFAGSADKGFLISSDTHFAFALGRPDAPASDALIEALRQGDVPDALSTHFGSIYAFGHWAGSDGVVEHCTNPLMRRRSCAFRQKDGFRMLVQDFNGHERYVEVPVLATA